MVEQAQNAVLRAPGFEKSDLAALTLFKESANDFLLAALPDEQIAPMDVNGNPYDPAFLSILHNYILNDQVSSNNPDLQALQIQYLSLPDSALLLIEDYNDYTAPPNSDPKENAAAGDRIVNRFQSSLGAKQTNIEPAYSPENDLYYVDIDDVTTHAISEELTKLKALNPDIDTDDFNPRVLNDGKAHDFMNRLVAKNMDAANVKPDDINMTLIHLWSLQQNDCGSQISLEDKNLANTSSLRDLIGLISTGTLPNGGSVSYKLNNSFNEATYNGAMTSDRFFSRDTYSEIIGNEEVLATTLFKDCGDDNPHLEDLKLAAKALNIDTESGVVKQEQLGQIAALMLEYHACKLGIAKDEITEAINDGRFMPDLDDLRLVEVGLGMPANLNTGNLSGHDAFIAEFYNRDAVNAFRTTQWENNFGKLPEDVISQKVNDLYDGNEANRDYIRSMNTLPSSAYKSPRFITGSTKPTIYEIKRTEYLAENAERLKPCVSEADKQPTNAETKAGKKPETSTQFSNAAKPDGDSQSDFETAAKEATGNDVNAIPEEELISDTTPDLTNAIAATN
ncbi:MAG: hypothetical protein ACRBDI_02105 [Alphaproteobacteria bacterium]